MAYVGRSPKYGFLEGQTATFNGSTTVVSLQRSVSSTDALDVYIDNVHQEPNIAYNLSSGGSAITFTGTPANGQKLYIRFHGISFDTARASKLTNTNADSTLTISDSHTLTLNLNGTTALTATTSGITIPNLTVTGTTTSVNSTQLVVGDNQIILNSDVGSGVAPSEDAGIVINRGSSADVAFLWDEGEDYWLAADPIVSSTRLSTIKGGTTPTIAATTVGLFQSSATSQSAAISIIANSGQSSILNFGDENDENAGSLTYSHSADTFALSKGLGVTGNITASGIGGFNDYIDLNTAGNRGKIGYDSNNLYVGSTSSTGEIHFKNNIGSTDAPHSSGDTKMVITDIGVDVSGAITSGSHLINASSSAFGGSSVQGFNTDFLVDTGQGYSRHNSYHTGGSNHQFLVNAAGSTTNTVALAINKDANATFAGAITSGGIIAGTQFHTSYSTLGQTGSGAMTILGHNATVGNGANIVNAKNTGYHSSFIKMYYNQGITFHSTTGTQTAGTELLNGTGSNSLERMRISNAGLVGIGCIPSHKLEIRNDVPANSDLDSTAIKLYNASDGGSAIEFSNGVAGKSKISFGVTSTGSGTDDTYLGFSTGTNAALSEGMRLDKNGDLNIAKFSSSMTTAGCRLGANGGSEIVAQGNNNVALKIASTDDSYVGLLEFYTAGGTQCGYILGNGSAVSLISNSDYRLKENVVDLTGATERLKQLPVHRFNFINNPSETVDGFLAHEVADIVPEAAHGAKDAVDEDGNAVMQGIDQSALVPLLVKTIQELEARITALEE